MVLSARPCVDALSLASLEILSSAASTQLTGRPGRATSRLTGRNAPKAPIRNSLAGALIGRMGNGVPFGIGNQALA